MRIFSIILAKRNFILFFLLKVLGPLLGLLSNIVIVRRLTVNDYGIYSVALMLIGLVTTFGFSWSSSSILYFGGKEKSQTGSISKTFWSRNIIIAVSLIIVTILFFLFSDEINAYVETDIAFLALIWVYVSVVEDYLSQYFLAVKNQILSGLLSVTAKVVFFTLILIFDFNVKSLVILNLISHASVLCYVLGMNKKDFGKFEFDSKWFKQILSFSLWQLFGFSGLYLINFGDIAVIKHFMTTEDAAVYNVAYRLFDVIASSAFIVVNYYAASIAGYFENREHSKIKHFFYKERIWILSASLLAHLLVIVFSKPIIIFFYGEKYESSVLIFTVLMLGSIFRYITLFYTLYYNTNKGYKVLQTVNIFRAIINVGLDILFIQWFGLIGPAIATALAIVLSFIFSAFYCERSIYSLSKG